MESEVAKQALLEFGGDAAERRRVAEIIRRLDEDGELRAAAAEYDRIRAALRPRTPFTSPEGGWDAYHERLLSGVRRRPKWLRFRRVAAVAASLMVGAALGRYALPPAAQPDSADAPVQTPRLAFTAEEIARYVSTFDELAQVFDQRARWVLVTEDNSDLGLGAPLSRGSSRLLLVRLVMSDAGGIVSTADLIIIPGETASVGVPLNEQRRLQYHVATSAGDPSRITLWVELEDLEDSGETLASLGSDLRLESGHELDAGGIIAPEGRYQLRVGFAQVEANGS